MCWGTILLAFLEWFFLKKVIEEGGNTCRKQYSATTISNELNQVSITILAAKKYQNPNSQSSQVKVHVGIYANPYDWQCSKESAVHRHYHGTRPAKPASQASQPASQTALFWFRESPGRSFPRTWYIGLSQISARYPFIYWLNRSSSRMLEVS